MLNQILIDVPTQPAAKNAEGVCESQPRATPWGKGPAKISEL